MKRWPIPEAQSALVVLLPEAETLVAPFRAVYDPSAAAGVPAHVTVLYPFMTPELIDDGIVRRLAACFGQHLPFDCKLSGIRQFPGLIYLAPEPDARFRALTESVREAFPEYQPYEGRHPDVVPHLTVASVSDPSRRESIAEELAIAAGGLLPVGAHIREIALMDNSQGLWSVSATIPLGTP
ncbi:2'-5' RNA ligase family protein [Nisaea sediminum]|uniref:2'-5' RNA ligase family protein n=1 Tax=Nisaea sediminum TaxID=2775867 RepID=UPI0018684F41|nr:2'-5' RNA ligase family protein [Nisaea sediminum]